MTSTQERRDARYLSLAQSVADIFSKDPSTVVGAVIVGSDHRDVAFGYNGFPPGIADNSRLNDREIKNRLTIHAERNALDNARFKTQGATLYTTLHPCHECAKSIISKGIGRVVIPLLTPRPDVMERWGESINWAFDMLDEAGVEIVTL